MRKRKWKRQLIGVFIIATLLANMSLPALAHTYGYLSGADYNAALGRPTAAKEPAIPDPMLDNVRRSKDAAYHPPSYGVFSGVMPTEPTSMYHTSGLGYGGYPSGTAKSYPGYAGYASNAPPDAPEPAPGDMPAPGLPPAAAGPVRSDMLPPTSIASASPDIVNTRPLYYDDGSIGTLSIPKLNLAVKVYEGETLENMRVGVGHFTFTSAWDGNVAIAGHNRSVPKAIGGVKDLKDGDEITYATKYGTRTYAVYGRRQIADTDYSGLGWSEANTLSIITCVEGVPDKRWLVVAKEKK